MSVVRRYLPSSFVLCTGLLLTFAALATWRLVGDHARSFAPARLAAGISTQLLWLVTAGWVVATFALLLFLAHSRRKYRLDLVNLEARFAERTERLAAEVAARESIAAELQAARARLELALASSDTCTWDSDLSASRVRFDVRWAAMQGGPAGETLTTPSALLQLTHPDERWQLSRVIARCTAGPDDAYVVEHRVRRPDDSWMWIMSRGRVAGRDANGRATRIIGTSTDITARKEAEAGARNRLAFLAALHETTLDLLRRRSGRNLLQAITERAARLLDTPHVDLALAEDDLLVVRASTCRLEAAIGERRTRANNATSWRAFDTRAPVLLDADSPGFDRPRAEGFHAGAVLPILHRGRCLGVLCLLRRKSERRLDTADLAHGASFCQLAALFLHNAAVYQDSVRLAEARTVELRQSEERFRNIFDHSPVPVALMTFPGGRILSVNAAMLAFAGRRETNLVDQVGVELDIWLEPEDREHIGARLKADGVIRNWEARVRNRAGRTGTVLFSGALVMSGGQRFSLATMVDITERKEAEVGLARSAALNQAIFDSSADGILVVDTTGRIQTHNRLLVDLGLIPAAALASRSLEHTLDHLRDQLLDPAGFRERTADLARQSDHHHFDILAFRDGRVFHRHSRPLVVAGETVGRVWSFRETTAERRAALALRENEERFRGVFDQSPIPILITSPIDGRVVEANAASLALFDFSREEVTARTTTELGLWSDSTQRDEFLTQLRATGKVHGMEITLRTRHGALVHLLCTGTLLTLGDRQLILSSAIDITARKQAETARARLEQSLRQSQKMESLGTLAGGIAHDFNNVLTGIFGFTDLARMSLPPDDPARGWLDQVSTTSQRAKDLVRQILTFSRRSEGDRIAQHLQAVVEEALRLLRSTLPAMVELDFRISKSAPPALADATQIHQIVMNLCTNAWHALPATGGRIVVTLEGCEITPAQATASGDLAAGPYLRLSVSDNGSGMGPAVAERIFEPFFTTKESGKGSGLGLAVVHGIVQSHGGTIHLDTAPGRGTRFDLYFPAIVAGPAPAASTPRPLPRGRGELLFLVDDDTASGLALENVIASFGYTVTRFERPGDLLARFNSAPFAPAAIVADLGMPDMPGDTLACELLRIRPGLPVLIVSGYVEPARQQSFERLGIRGLVRKPPDREEFAHRIHSLVAAGPSSVA